jgi:HlyD family secretion protein
MNDTLQAPADAPPPKKRKAGILIALVLAIVVVVGLWLAWRTPAEQLQGMADADTINVAAKITARLAELKVREGDRVTAGQVLFVLDSPEVAAKEQQAQGALEAARAVADKADEGARSEDIRAAQANWKRAEAGATCTTKG